MTTRAPWWPWISSRVIFSACCRSWMASPIWRLMAWAAARSMRCRACRSERPGLRLKTVELYGYLFSKHLAAVLGPVLIADIQPAHIRRS